MKKETKLFIAVAVVVVIILAVMYYLKGKAQERASKDFVDYVHGNTPQNIEYPALRDLVGFDEGDILNYKGNRFKANLVNNRWDLIPA
jgi:hypothetical protein